MHLHVSVLGDHPQGVHCYRVHQCNAPRGNQVVTHLTHQHTGHVNISTSFNFVTSIFNIQHSALDLHHNIVNIYILDFAHDSIDVLCNSEHTEDGRLRPKHVDA